MGEKATKFVATAGAVVVLIAGVAQFGDGLMTLFGPPALPECDSADASDLVRKIIADNFAVELERLDEVAQSAFDDGAQKRGCTAVIDAGAEGVFAIAFDLTWHDRDDRMVAAEVAIVEQRS